MEVFSMSKTPEYIVGPDGNSGWKTTRSGASRAGFTGATQAEVYEQVRDSLKGAAGGEISVQGRDGKIREKNTIAPKPDKNPPKG